MIGIKIDKEVPAPTGRAYAKYPLAEMDVGDSFVAVKSNVASAVSHWSKRNGKKFTIRKTSTGDYRVWRIA